MSAFQVSRNHVWHLIEAAMHRRFDPGAFGFSWYHEGHRHDLRIGDYASAAQAGQMLADANIESLRARYQDADAAMIGWREYGDHGPSMGEATRFDAVALLKACDCFEYQACEHEGWEASEACAFLNALRRRLWRALPGYGDAKTWGIA